MKISVLCTQMGVLVRALVLVWLCDVTTAHQFTHSWLYKGNERQESVSSVRLEMRHVT